MTVTERICQLEASQNSLTDRVERLEQERASQNSFTDEVERLKQERDELKQQIDECLKNQVTQGQLKESIDKVFNRLEALEKRVATIEEQVKENMNRHENDVKTCLEEHKTLIEGLHKQNAEIQAEMKEMLSVLYEQRNSPIKTPPKQIPQPQATAGGIDSGFRSDASHLVTTRQASSMEDSSLVKKLQYDMSQ